MRGFFVLPLDYNSEQQKKDCAIVNHQKERTMTVTIPIEVLMYPSFIAVWCMFYSALRIASCGAFKLDTDTLFLMGVLSGALSAFLVDLFGVFHPISAVAMSAMFALPVAVVLIKMQRILAAKQVKT